MEASTCSGRPCSTEQNIHPRIPRFQQAFDQIENHGTLRCWMNATDWEDLASDNLLSDNIFSTAVQVCRSAVVVAVPPFIWTGLCSSNKDMRVNAANKCREILDSRKLVAMPICIAEHWVLAIIDQHTIRIYDSLLDRDLQNGLISVIGANLRFYLKSGPVMRFYTTVLGTAQQRSSPNCLLHVLYRIIYWDDIENEVITEEAIADYIAGRGRADLTLLLRRIEQASSSQDTAFVPQANSTMVDC